MVGLGHTNNFTTIRLLDDIIYACRVTVSGFAPLNATPYQRKNGYAENLLVGGNLLDGVLVELI